MGPIVSILDKFAYAPEIRGWSGSANALSTVDPEGWGMAFGFAVRCRRLSISGEMRGRSRRSFRESSMIQGEIKRPPVSVRPST